LGEVSTALDLTSTADQIRDAQDQGNCQAEADDCADPYKSSPIGADPESEFIDNEPGIEFHSASDLHCRSLPCATRNKSGSCRDQESTIEMDVPELFRQFEITITAQAERASIVKHAGDRGRFVA